MNVDVNVTLDLSPRLEAALMNVLVRLPWLVDPSEKLPPSTRPDVSVASAPPPAKPEPTAPTFVEPIAQPVAEPIKRWTDERIAILGLYYPAGDALKDILSRLNACEGPVVSYDQMKAKIIYLDLKREQPAQAVSSPPNPADPVGETDDATIRHWAAARGLCNGGEPLNLQRINAKRSELGLAPFVRTTGLAASAGTMRAPSGVGR